MFNLDFKQLLPLLKDMIVAELPKRFDIKVTLLADESFGDAEDKDLSLEECVEFINNHKLYTFYMRDAREEKDTNNVRLHIRFKDTLQSIRVDLKEKENVK